MVNGRQECDGIMSCFLVNCDDEAQEGWNSCVAHAEWEAEKLVQDGIDRYRRGEISVSYEEVKPGVWGYLMAAAVWVGIIGGLVLLGMWGQSW